jgi:recombination protein RecT
MPDVRTAVATREQEKAEKKKAALRFVEQLGPQIARALPAHLTGDRMTRLALTAVQKTPDLAECSQVSFAGALLTAAAMGLEPNTPAGEAYLVPYKGEATLIVGYAGFVKLFWQHPLAQSLRAEAVYEADDFDYSYGTGAFLRHKPARRQGDAGDPVAYYAHATLTTGAEAFVVLTPNEVKALRGGKTGSNGGIPDPQHWMERKTCIRQLVKMLPKSPNLARAAQADEQGGTELYRAAAAERGQVITPAAPAAIEGGIDLGTGEITDQGATQPAAAVGGGDQ